MKEGPSAREPNSHPDNALHDFTIIPIPVYTRLAPLIRAAHDRSVSRQSIQIGRCIEANGTYGSIGMNFDLEI